MQTFRRDQGFTNLGPLFEANPSTLAALRSGEYELSFTGPDATPSVLWLVLLYQRHKVREIRFDLIRSSFNIREEALAPFYEVNEQYWMSTAAIGPMVEGSCLGARTCLYSGF